MHPLRERKSSNLKETFKSLKEVKISKEQEKEVISCVLNWMQEEQGKMFVMLGNSLHSWAEEEKRRGNVWKAIARDCLPIAEKANFPHDDDMERVIKRFINSAVTHGVRVHEVWAEALRHRKVSVELSRWIAKLSRKGTLQEKQAWEQFIASHGHPNILHTNTTTQSAEIVVGGAACRSMAEKVVVWNGNGMRARWAGKCELKEVVRAVNPDVLCFLESKINSEKLLNLPGFEEWMTESQFCYANCYWSTPVGNAKTHGNEGIVIFSKVKPARVTHGMDHDEFDKQARIMRVEFTDWILLVTYNPQGGFAEHSLRYRDQWELAFTSHLEKIATAASKTNKRLVWAGDFNVNPLQTDWTIRAFDRIRHRMPPGTPAGCRTTDQMRYREMLRQMRGVNVAEHFGKQTQRTCFADQELFERNFGQRIDHVVADRSLLDKHNDMRITAFDTLQIFGAGRSGASDHCPLYFTLQRRLNQPREQKQQPELDEETLREIRTLAQDVVATDRRPMSRAFRDGESDDECEAENCFNDEEANAEAAALTVDDDDEDEEQRLFEDVPMPILKCHVLTSKEPRSVRILVDSGSSIDLINGKVARELERLGAKRRTVEQTNITVANGRRNTISAALDITLVIKGEQCESRKFLILDDLPYDMLLGHNTCVKWQAKLEWGKAKFSLKPNNSSGRIEVEWNANHKAQHWRKPISLILTEDVELPQDSQVVVAVRHEGHFNESGQG